MKAHNSSLQRTAPCGLAAELRSFGALINPVLKALALCVWLAPSLASAQVPSWAGDTQFDLADVEMSLTRPSGGWRQVSAEGKVSDDAYSFQGYTATIHGDGRVTVDLDTEKGPLSRLVRADLPRDAIYSLLQQFVQVQFFDLPSLYNGGATLSPWAYHVFKPPLAKFRITQHHTVMDGTYLKLRLKIAEHEKTIMDWNGEGPKFLDEIARTIEDSASLSKGSK